MTSFSQGGFFIETKGEREIIAQTSFGACGSCIDNSGSDTAGSISDAEGVYSGILGDCGAPDCRDSSGVDCGETLRGNRGAGRSDRCWIVSDLRPWESLRKFQLYLFGRNDFRVSIVHIVQLGRFVHFP